VICIWPKTGRSVTTPKSILQYERKNTNRSSKKLTMRSWLSLCCCRTLKIYVSCPGAFFELSKFLQSLSLIFKLNVTLTPDSFCCKVVSFILWYKHNVLLVTRSFNNNLNPSRYIQGVSKMRVLILARGRAC
jgi:hypothetical protein